MTRKRLQSIFTLLLTFALYTSSTYATFNEKQMREHLRSAPSEDTYYSLNRFPESAQESLTDEIKNKSTRIYELVKKTISLELQVTLSQIISIVSFIEKMKPTLKKHFETHSSVYVHSESTLGASVMAYESGRIYIVFENDKGSVSGGFKRFTRSIEYNSEKAHAHLTIRKKSKYTKLRDIIKELHIQQAFEGIPSILNFLDADVYTERKENGHHEHVIAIEEELFDGDLGAMVLKRPNLDVMIDMFSQMAKAVKEMHGKRYVHRDIKPDNFLFRLENANIHVVLADFGLSESRKSSEFGQYMCGTSGFIDLKQCVYVSSEDGVAFHDFKEGKEADVFSLGMSFAEILLGTENRLATNTRQVNDIIFDEGAEKKKVEKAIEKFKALHAEEFPNRKNFQGNKDILFRLRDLIGRMIHPEDNRRIHLTEVIERLGRLNRDVIRMK